MTRGRQIVSLVVAAAVLGAALAAYVAHTLSVKRALVSFLEDNVMDDEIVLITLTDTSTLGELEGMKVLFTDVVFWNDVVGYPGAWIVGSESTVVPILGDVTVHDVGPYRVHHLDLTRGVWAERGFDLVGNLPLASVQRIEETLRPCPLSGGFFACPFEPWFSVTVRRVSMDGEPFECIYAHPKNASRLHVVYSTTPGGSSLTLEGGIDDDGVHYPEGSDVQVRAMSGSRDLGTLTFVNVPGVQTRRLVFSTPVDKPAPLVLEITSENQDTRHFCFRGYME